MLRRHLMSGLAVGAVYAMIGVTYNVMFSASRVMSFTAGQLGMLGGVLGAAFIGVLGCPPSSASCSPSRLAPWSAC
jgi:branched-chain amino acid transport system permease protein